jgi:outer membrane protein assembly factor BamD
MTQRNTENSLPSSIQSRSFSPVRSFFTDARSTSTRGLLTTGFAVAVLLASTIGARAQDTTAAPDAAAQPPAATQTDTQAKPNVAVTNQKPGKTRKKDERVVQSKDTKKEVKKTAKTNQLEGMDAKLPDKTLYDKAEDAIKHGRYDVGRLDLQTLLNTYPDSQFQMRSKLAIADSWFKEGGTAALTQAEQEYKDFITFFPNAPEAAEAQMRVGDIYFKQMDKPDRDYTKTVQAEQEYRLMLQQFPDSPLVPQARQRLREVQETLASRESDIANFYSTRSNWPATIARYQTVIDTYPLYSHLDDVLVSLGDAYMGEARFVRTLNLPEAGKAKLLSIYEGQAAAAYRKVILEHSAAAHVEDARDRLVAMNLPIPTPTPDQAAASAALENSRGQYTLSKRAVALFMRSADTVPAATMGEPPLEDAKPTLAPAIVRQSITDFNTSMNPANAQHAGQPISANDSAAPAAGASDAAPAAAPLSLQDVPSANNAGSSSPAVTSVPAATPATRSAGTSMGIEIVQPSASDSSTPPSTTFPGTAAPATATPATAPATTAVPAPDPIGGIKPVGPPNATALAPVEKAEKPPEAINEVTPGSQPAAAQAPPANGKKAKPAFDKGDESSSKHKKKKGLGKLNPF